MNYDETCREIQKEIAHAGYRAMTLDYDRDKRGPGRYLVSAKNPDGIRVIIAYTGSYADLLTETREYFGN